MASSRQRFSVQRQPGFTAIAMACFFLLYFPIVVLVVYTAITTAFIGGMQLVERRLKIPGYGT